MSISISRRNSDALLARPFLVSLLLLVANDFLLKARFHNAITGKLSDFAGLFAFTFFWTALVPRRRHPIAIATTIGFVWWKSAASGAFIALWNSHMPYAIGRVIDWSDLIALLVLPIASALALRPAHVSPRLLQAPVIVAALFAFAATKVAGPPHDLGHPGPMDIGYASHQTAKGFLASAERHGIRVAVANIPTSTTVPPGYTLTFADRSCAKGFTATVELIPQSDGRVNVWLEELRSNCGGAPYRYQTRAFDHDVATPLGLQPLR